MLAFNLGVFFRNLRGEEVAFSARSSRCEVHFTGGVVSLQEHTDLSRHLSVALGKGDLLLRLAFEEDDEGDPEDSEVEVRLLREHERHEQLLLQTTFYFRDVSLKPASEAGETPPGDAGPDDEPDGDPDDGPMPA